ncbi:MAG: Bug family tripartite tricarboxylate transporter substrate binding protein [Gemmatimonas sp.]
MYASFVRAARTVAALTAFIAVSGAAVAQDAAAFYKGKTMRLVVGFSPGGGYDAYTRLLARHYGRYIPGSPDIIVNNMPGASSLKSVQYLDSGAPKDGTVLTAFNPGLIVQSMTTPDKFPIDLRRYEWIGSISEDIRVCYMWHATGVKTWDDLLKRPQVIFGETGTGSSAYVNERILKDVFGVKVKQVLGYPGSAEKRLAIERGELDGDCGSFSSIPPDWVRERKIDVVIRFEQHLAPGMTADAPYAPDLAKDAKQRQLLMLLNSSGDVGRPYIAPRGVPAERLKALRAAFDQVVKDPQFVADAEKQQLTVIAPLSGDDAYRMVEEIYKSPPDVVAQAKDITGE